MKSKILLFLVLLLPLFGDEEVRFVFAKSAQDIDLIQGKDVLVRSFMNGYEDVPLLALNPDFKSIGDVRRFYENYFESELEHYRHGELLWVQAFAGEKLLGWATFELESMDTAYMNLLAVAPEYQRKGIGKQLVFSICSEFPNIKAINVLVRKVNVGGENFYRKIGFIDWDSTREDNFVDINLLSGFRWTQSQ